MDSKDIRALVMAKKIAGGSGGGNKDLEDFLTKATVVLKSNSSDINHVKCADFTNLVEVDLPNITGLPTDFFYRCGKLEKVNMPKLVELNTSCFKSCVSLKTADFLSVRSIKNDAFSTCTSLKTVILRYSEHMVSLANARAFNNTGFTNARYGPGTLYVPQALISDYQEDSTWGSVIYELSGNQILSIEGSPYE